MRCGNGRQWEDTCYTALMSPTLLCLHGWGGSKESFTELREALKSSGIEILTPDLPGFGDTPEPEHPWTVDDYADWVEQWFQKTLEARDSNLEHLSLLGHSHGGRIAIKLAARRSLSIRHLYLCAAAGIPHRKTLRKAVGTLLAKAGSLFFAVPGLQSLRPIGKKILYKMFHVHDYEVASPIMRKTMQNVTTEDLRPALQHIHVPTDLFWGTDDTQTPLKDGELMHHLIPNSHLHVFKGIRHRVHRDKAKEIAEVIMKNI